jgi:hypothetical protein
MISERQLLRFPKIAIVFTEIVKPFQTSIKALPTPSSSIVTRPNCSLTLLSQARSEDKLRLPPWKQPAAVWSPDRDGSTLTDRVGAILNACISEKGRKYLVSTLRAPWSKIIYLNRFEYFDGVMGFWGHGVLISSGWCAGTSLPHKPAKPAILKVRWYTRRQRPISSPNNSVIGKKKKFRVALQIYDHANETIWVVRCNQSIYIYIYIYIYITSFNASTCAGVKASPA